MCGGDEVSGLSSVTLSAWHSADVTSWLAPSDSWPHNVSEQETQIKDSDCGVMEE